MPSHRILGFAVLVLTAARVSAQPAFWSGLPAGPDAVGFRIVDTVDATRSFPSGDGRVVPRPMRLYVWYPARPRTGSPMRLSDLVSEAWANGGVTTPSNKASFSRTVVRIRSGPELQNMSDATADSLLAAPIASLRDARATGKRVPVVLFAPSQPLTMLVAAELLASNGIMVVSPARKDVHTFESVEFTPNATSIDAESEDLAFALAYARGRRDVRADDLGLLGYSSSGISNLAFAFRSRAPRAIAVFEGWEAWEVGQPIVRGLKGYDPRGFRSAYLLLEKTAEESAPALRKTSAFFDSMAYAPRWRIAFDGAAHPDFASFAVALPSAPATLRRNFVRAHELLRDFFISRLNAPASSVAEWSGPSSESWMHVTHASAQHWVPTFDEFFHLAETSPSAADTLAQRLAALSPAVVPFTESSLSRLALITSSRDAFTSSILYGIVVRAFPRSLNARVALSDMLASSGRAAEARATAQVALELLAADTTMSESQRVALRQRLTARTAP